MRRNRAQAESAEDYGVSQPTISRAISAVTPLLVKALSGFAPTADDLGDGTHYIVDGTLLPCWTWRACPELKSGKYRASGFKVLLNGADPRAFAGDIGFSGSGMITPFRKPKHRELFAWEKEFNTGVARFRWVIEQVIANFKT